MTDLPLTKISETTRTITLGWTPIACEGYEFLAGGTRVSNTWDASKSSIKFSKVASGKYTVRALGITAEGSYPPVVTPPTGIAKPTYAIVETPNYFASQDGPDANYQAVWVGNPDGTYTLDRNVQPHFAGAYMFEIGPGWDPSRQGNWGRMWNFHNTADDNPQGYGWDLPPGNSAVAIDYIGGDLVINVDDNPVKNYTVAPNLVKGSRHTVGLKMALGRVDGTTAERGHVQVAFDGQYVLDLDCNTQWKWANGAIQHKMWVWAGFYTQAIPNGSTLPFTISYPFYGHDSASALSNASGGGGGPWAISDIPIPGKDHSLGPATCTPAASWSSSDLVLPAGW